MRYPSPKPGEIPFIIVGLSLLLVILGLVGLYLRFTGAPDPEVASRLTQYSLGSIGLGVVIGTLFWTVRKLME